MCGTLGTTFGTRRTDGAGERPAPCDDRTMTMPLDGLRVIDWTIWQQGPVCSAYLGDLGAEVIKIEERIGGDPGRGVAKMGGMDHGLRFI